MKCPFCGYEESKVIDSRPTDEGERIRRRRECLECSKRFTTYEMIESLPIIVIKKDKSRETFNRDKLMTGLLRACEKRPVSFDTLDNMIDEIESTIQNSLDREVTSVKIGELVMDKLKEINDIAYVRFASVYREFKDIDTFLAELKELRSESFSKRKSLCIEAGSCGSRTACSSSITPSRRSVVRIQLFRCWRPFSWSSV